MSGPLDVGFIVAVCKGLIRDRTNRRSALFAIVLATLCMVFLGSVFFNGWLVANPIWFLVYWGLCLWLTLTSALLALYDLLAIRLEALSERRRLSAGVLGINKPQPPRKP